MKNKATCVRFSIFLLESTGDWITNLPHLVWVFYSIDHQGGWSDLKLL